MKALLSAIVIALAFVTLTGCEQGEPCIESTGVANYQKVECAPGAKLVILDGGRFACICTAATR